MRSRTFRYLSLMAADAVIINLSIYLTLLLRFEARIPDPILQNFIHLIPVFTLVTLFFMAALKLYGRIWAWAK